MLKHIGYLLRIVASLLPRGLALRDVSSPGHVLWKSNSMWQGSYQVTGLIIMSHEVSHEKAEPRRDLSMALTLLLSPCLFFSILAYTGNPNSDFLGTQKWGRSGR